MGKEKMVDLDNLADVATDHYRQTVYAVATGESLTERRLLEVCTAAGRSFAQFKIDVETAKKAITAAAVMPSVAEPDPEAVALAERIETLQLEHNRRNEENNRKNQEFLTEYNALNDELSAKRSDRTQRKLKAEKDFQETRDPRISQRRIELQRQRPNMDGLPRDALTDPRIVKKNAAINAELMELARQEADVLDGMSWS